MLERRRLRLSYTPDSPLIMLIIKVAAAYRCMQHLTLRNLGLRLSIILISYGGLIPHAHALEFRCQAPGDVRYLQVEIPGKERLCEVSVNYNNSGERKMMWHARSDTMFCSARAYELRDKYESQWGFSCDTRPDRDGVDKLSYSQREILDELLKQSMKRAAEAIPPYRITAVKAVASTLLEGKPGKLAFQFFSEQRTITQIVDDAGGSWAVLATVDNLQNQLDSGVDIDTALISSIDDKGLLEVKTYPKADASLSCVGSQLISVLNRNTILPRNPHRYYCESIAGGS